MVTTLIDKNYLDDTIYHYILNVLNYIKKYNQEKDIKLLSILKKGMDILSNSTSKTLTISQDEKYMFDSVRQITEYITNEEYYEYNVNYLYSLLINFFDYVEKKIQYNTNIITEKEYNIVFDQYQTLLLSHEKEFIENILNKKDYPQFEDLIVNNTTELALKEVEEKNEDPLTVDEFFDELEKW